MTAGAVFGAIIFVAMLALLFVPMLLEILIAVSSKMKARKKAGVPRRYPGC